LALRFHTDRFQHRGMVLAAEFAPQDAGHGEAAQRAAGYHTYLDEITRMQPCGRHALGEEMTTGVTGMGTVDGDHVLEVIGAKPASCACSGLRICAHETPHTFSTYSW
jgi:hypothetical protein